MEFWGNNRLSKREINLAKRVVLQYGVPTTVKFLLVSSGLAVPKSTNLTAPLEFNKRFPALISRCTMPWAWRYLQQMTLREAKVKDDRHALEPMKDLANVKGQHVLRKDAILLNEAQKRSTIKISKK